MSADLAPLPITVLIAAKNEEANLAKCLAALKRAARIVVLDSHSTDSTAAIARDGGAEVVQFDYQGGYPKKRQWALDNLDIATSWVLLVDADECIPDPLWTEIAAAIGRHDAPDAFLITKGFHFMGQAFRFGGFSFAAVLLFKKGKARFERLHADAADGLDMEVHERLVVQGTLGRLKTSLIHDDFKGLMAYIDRHNRYSSWDAGLRHGFLATGKWGEDTIRPRLLGNTQERRRYIKSLLVRLPFEPLVWFAYHYLFRLGFLEGRRGLIACRIRANYISDVRAKVFELGLKHGAGKTTAKSSSK